MPLFSNRNNEDKGYLDNNQNIKWLGANLRGDQLKICLQESKFPIKIFGLALITGLLAGIVLSLI